MVFSVVENQFEKTHVIHCDLLIVHNLFLKVFRLESCLFIGQSLQHTKSSKVI